MSNVKPGDLAMVVNAPAPCESFNGATCTILRSCNSTKLMWHCYFPRMMPALACDGQTGISPARDVSIGDEYLRKIGGPDVSIDAMQFNPLAHEQTA